MTEKEVVRIVKAYVTNQIEAQGFDVWRMDYKTLTEDIEEELQRFVYTYALGLDKLETAPELED